MDPFLKLRPAEELFNVSNDPNQLKNIASNPEYCKVMSDMRKLMDEWQSRTGDTTLSLDTAIPDRYDRRTAKPIHRKSGRSKGGIAPDETIGAPKINDSAPR